VWCRRQSGWPAFAGHDILAVIGGLALVDDALQQLEAWLTKSGITTKGAGAAAVEALEQRYDVTLPEDFRTYLLELSPDEESLDDEVTNWWPVGDIKSIPDENRHEISHPEIELEKGQYLFFADFMLWCWAWAICCSNGPNRGRVAVIAGQDEFVADSFSEFVERYLRDELWVAPGANEPPQKWRRFRRSMAQKAERHETAIILTVGGIVLLVCLAGLLGWLPLSRQSPSLQ
jgi:hypothetical protein